jgi:hypothetical protein
MGNDSNTAAILLTDGDRIPVRGFVPVKGGGVFDSPGYGGG